MGTADEASGAGGGQDGLDAVCGAEALVLAVLCNQLLSLPGDRNLLSNQYLLGIKQSKK